MLDVTQPQFGIGVFLQLAGIICVAYSANLVRRKFTHRRGILGTMKDLLSKSWHWVSHLFSKPESPHVVAMAGVAEVRADALPATITSVPREPDESSSTEEVVAWARAHFEVQELRLTATERR